jgi:hypothetical protein
MLFIGVLRVIAGEVESASIDGGSGSRGQEWSLSGSLAVVARTPISFSVVLMPRQRVGSRPTPDMARHQIVAVKRTLD